MSTTTTPGLSPYRAVLLVGRREFVSRVRTRSFVIGTIVIIALIAGYVLLQTTLFSQNNRDRVGLTGQATVLGQPLKQTAEALGQQVEIQDVASVDQGAGLVRDGDLDALVSGAPDALRVTVKDDLDEPLRAALNSIVQQQVLDAQLAEAGLDPRQVRQNMAAVTVEVNSLEPADPQRGERLAVGLMIAFLLYFSLAGFGSTVAQGVVEEKASRVVEVLLATIRPWQLLTGKILGIGAVGLLQILIIGTVGAGLATATDVLTVPSVAFSAVAIGALWYLLGFLLYATVFAASGSLVSRQEDAQSVISPTMMVIMIAFVAGFSLLAQDPTSSTVAVMSLIPPFAPILMPSRMVLGVAPTWQVLLAVLLALAATAALIWLGGRVYANAVLRTGARVKLRDALR